MILSASAPDWLKLAGWTPASAEIIYLHRAGPYALAIFATKSDPSHFELGVFAIGVDGSWSLVNESSDVSLDGEFGWSPSCVYGWGRTQPGTTMRVEYRWSSYIVESDSAGWWAFVRGADPAAGQLLLPRVIYA